jgi:hypothetical protein
MLKRVAAALTAGSKKYPCKEIQSIAFRVVDVARVTALGIQIATSDGETRDAEVNKLHRELRHLTAAQAIALLRNMNGRERIFSAQETARFISQGIVRKQLSPDVLNRDLLQSLHQKRAVKIIIAPVG